MGGIINRDRWQQQPTRPLWVDWRHPLSQALIECGYVLGGLQPYSAVGVATPLINGTGAPDIRSHGHGITVNASPNYISLGRNISAPTLVASSLVRTTVESLATAGILLTSSGPTPTNYIGHFVDHSTAGVMTAHYGNNTGAGAPNRRSAASASGVVVAGVPATLAFACRGATDWSLYMDGRNLGTPTYSGTASSYVAGTAYGTINYRNVGTVYGNQTAASWAHWSRALTDGEMQALYEAPFQFLEPIRRRVWVAFAEAVAGDTVLAATPAAAAAATAALTTAIQFAGAAVSVAGASAGLGTQIPLQAAAVSVAAAGADLSASIRFNALAVAQAGASAGLDTAILLAMAAGAQASGNGDLSTEIRLLAAAQGNAAASAGFDAGTAALVADALSSASATALLDTQIRLAAAAQAAASGAAELTVEIRLAADAAAQAAGFADLTATIRLDALALVQAAASGDLATQIVLTADAAAQASATATFGTVLVFATPAVEFFVSAPARAWQIPPVTHFLIAA